MTAETLDRAVIAFRSKKYCSLDLTSRLKCEEALRFALELASKNGNADLANGIKGLINEVDEIDTGDLVDIGTFKGV